MKKIFLFPNYLKIPALLVFLTSIILLIFKETELFTLDFQCNVLCIDLIKKPHVKIKNNNIYSEIINICYFVSGIILAFTKQKIEDEMVGLIRYKALTTSSFFLVGLLVFAEVFFYEFTYFVFLIIYFYAFVLVLNGMFYSKLYVYYKKFSDDNED